ncbi:MAG: hypothetical protein AAF694_20715 [Bacteroidota bacterium]
MKEEQELYELLLNSLDGSLSPEEAERLKSALAKSDSLRAERDELMRLRNTLKDTSYQFKPFFPARVMNEIEQLDTPSSLADYWLWAFRRVALPGLAILIFLILFTWLKDGSMSWDALTGVSSFEQEELLTEYFSSSIDYLTD